jgi:hypothetical protein
MTHTIAARDYLIQDAAGPLDAVARAIGEAPGTLSPCVTAAALILAAEQLTAEAEACQVCLCWPGQCEACQQRSESAFTYRELAEQLMNGGAR